MSQSRVGLDFLLCSIPATSPWCGLRWWPCLVPAQMSTVLTVPTMLLPSMLASSTTFTNKKPACVFDNSLLFVQGQITLQITFPCMRHQEQFIFLFFHYETKVCSVFYCIKLQNGGWILSLTISKGKNYDCLGVTCYYVQ